MKRTFQPNNAKKAKKQGFRAKMETSKGQATLKRRRKKGRKNITTV